MCSRHMVYYSLIRLKYNQPVADKSKPLNRRLSRTIRMLTVPLAVAFIVILYREAEYNRENETGDWEFDFSAQEVSNLVNDGIDSQFLSKENIQQQVQSIINEQQDLEPFKVNLYYLYTPHNLLFSA